MNLDDLIKRYEDLIGTTEAEIAFLREVQAAMREAAALMDGQGYVYGSDPMEEELIANLRRLAGEQK